MCFPNIQFTSVRFNHLSNAAALDGAAKACTFNATFPSLGFRLQNSAVGLPVAVVTDIFSVNISPPLFFNYPAFLERCMSPAAATEPPPLSPTTQATELRVK